jgi:hypothetical protein
MNKLMNFEDNIFILMMRIRLVRDSTALEADPELFLEKTLDDICFIDSTFRVLLNFLLENNKLIEREELLDHYCEAERQFSQVLSVLPEHEGNLSVRNIKSICEKLGVFYKSSQERRKIAEGLFDAAASTQGSPVVSTDELTELLKAF